MPQHKRDGDEQQGVIQPAFASQEPPRFVEPTLGKTVRGVSQREIQNYIAGTETRQSMYATASGTLTQFNAIMVGLNGIALSTSAGVLKILIAVGLLTHIAAAFVLCWAARPVVEKVSAQAIHTAITQYRHTDDTFRNYRRGWRMTLLALAVSSAAAAIFVFEAFDLLALVGMTKV